MPISEATPAGHSLAEARKGFTTHLIERHHHGRPAEHPPSGMLQLVHDQSPVGPLAAYLTPAPGPGRRPAIIWITGGDYTSIGDVWTPATAENDQSAAQYRNAGMVVMYPSLRSGNDNPGSGSASWVRRTTSSPPRTSSRGSRGSTPDGSTWAATARAARWR